MILIASDGIIIRIPAGDISEFARPSKGVRVMRISEGERVMTLSVTPHEEEKTTEDAETAEDATEATETENPQETAPEA